MLLLLSRLTVMDAGPREDRRQAQHRYYIRYIYTGSATVTAGSIILPSFSFYSMYPLSPTGNTPVGGKAENSDGTPTANLADVHGPQNPTPERATITLFGSALLGIGFFARKRSKKS